jgi:phage shock protein C
MTRLYRSEEERILGGVCGGIAEIYDLDPSIVRLVTLVIILSSGAPLILYLAAWLIIPPKSEVVDELEETESEREKEQEKEQESESEQEEPEEGGD